MNKTHILIAVLVGAVAGIALRNVIPFADKIPTVGGATK